MSLERQALNNLLALHPEFDVLRVDWQLGERELCNHLDCESGKPCFRSAGMIPGPWLMVTLGQRSDDGAEAWAERTYAIWKSTGAIHFLQHDGSVSDDALPL